MTRRNSRVKGEQLSVHFGGDVLEEIASARIHFPGQEESLSPEAWFAILSEEVGEVARGLNEGESVDRLYDELVQVAAMAGRMALSVRNNDREGGGASVPPKVGGYVSGPKQVRELKPPSNPKLSLADHAESGNS